MSSLTKSFDLPLQYIGCRISIVFTSGNIHLCKIPDNINSDDRIQINYPTEWGDVDNIRLLERRKVVDEVSDIEDVIFD